MTGTPKKKVGLTYKGWAKPDDPAYNEGWSVNIPPPSEPKSPEPTKSTLPKPLRPKR